MQITPPPGQAAELYAAGQPFVLSTRLVADLETPVAAFMKLARQPGPSFLLESVEGGAVRGRYSMIGLAPDLVWRCMDGQAAINRAPDEDPEGFVPETLPPLESLRRLIAESEIALAADLPPMAAGIFGYLGYDMVRQMERLPDANPDRLGVPDAILLRPTVMAVFDSVRDELTLVAPVRPRPGLGAKAAFEAAAERLEAAVAALDAPLHADARPDVDGLALPSPVSNTTPAEFERMVARAQEYVRAGDVFQVVLGQRFECPFPLPALSLYRALRRVNPSPYLCYLDFAGFQIVCSSPEILVRSRSGKVTIRPLAGTRARGATEAEDRALGEDLLTDPKERAEHLMLLDLGRNDVGRVSKTGTVKVTESFVLERYSHVQHIVSNVEGDLDPRHDALDALIAGFPAGTLSGAPKVRAMEIIDELEKDKRGPFGGCIGYFGANGEMDTCIVLRTAIVKDGRMAVQAGAGVVYDSVPAAEQQECVNKAKALFRAAEEAVRFAAAARRGQ
ncbi:anthranilate synthase component I [Chelatococcus reniformis]|uniref:Anthranilate synthase component 1 n=1 Tax=Chelatococcus reniformis TaxID=1494448 RepID=A0A916UF32_9HYPH|nr:anthranilate synthase component I [Chelatococcus reniformis]GGC69602.1 anthranilate synthase component I [Chelatococcus reniformis]